MNYDSIPKKNILQSNKSRHPEKIIYGKYVSYKVSCAVYSKINWYCIQVKLAFAPP